MAGDSFAVAGSVSIGTAYAIELHEVTKTYPGPPEVRALRSCTLRIGGGDFVAVTGQSGSGKSTLLNVLGLLDQPTSGEYVLAGVPTSGLTDSGVAAVRGRQLGFVFQAFHLLHHRTAVENVALGLTYQGIPRGERIERAAETLERVGIGHRMHARPSALSGGEAQRVAIARAVVHRPTVLLCDEPTGNLDSETARSVLEVLHDLNAAGTTIVLVTHDQAVAGEARRSIRIRDGQVDMSDLADV